MKHFKKLNAKGFAHWVIPALAIVVIGGIGTILLTRSHADVLTGSAICGSGYAYPSPYSLAVNSSTTIGNANGQQGPARVFVYQNKSLKKLCAVLQSTGAANGVSKPMSVKLIISKSTGGTISSGYDSGTYKYYAGPVYASYASTAGTDWRYNLVVDEKASMTYKGVTYNIVYNAGQDWAW